MGIARQIGIVLPMDTMLYFKALLTIDGVVLRIAPELDYKKEVRRAMRLIRMRELDKMYSPGAVIDRALSLQLLANSLPDFLIQRLQDFEQGKKTIYRKLNLIPEEACWLNGRSNASACGQTHPSSTIRSCSRSSTSSHHCSTSSP
jgi:hypothetical protein